MSERFLIAAREQRLKTRNQSKSCNENTRKYCGLCEDVWTYINWKLSQIYGLTKEKGRYMHTPKVFIEHENATVFWNIPIHPDKVIWTDTVITGFIVKSVF